MSIYSSPCFWSGQFVREKLCVLCRNLWRPRFFGSTVFRVRRWLGDLFPVQRSPSETMFCGTADMTWSLLLLPGSTDLGIIRRFHPCVGQSVPSFSRIPFPCFSFSGFLCSAREALSSTPSFVFFVGSVVFLSAEKDQVEVPITTWTSLPLRCSTMNVGQVVTLPPFFLQSPTR